MILSNQLIASAVKNNWIEISGLTGKDPATKPFNTSAVDLHLGSTIQVLEAEDNLSLDPRSSGIARLFEKHSKTALISENQPYRLEKGKLILANTVERVNFPLDKTISLEGVNAKVVLAGRVEGRSSLARCGLLVHFTAPTIHAGFSGNITLEIINLGPFKIELTPGMAICQLIIEVVLGDVVDAPNQFRGQSRPTGA